ncbi:tetratricopeptide repeat protein [Antarcticibacterium flavum]|uniref:Tetratricopeptide repeat protein n=1 Tax=Antarcticibacterium flavum TaxID=2058175 RepID=A0A5B7X2A3_9FLAO|nr:MULTISPECIES: tetratricopeptide repeat protein [Antarcticibacterium]MCM4159126.1 ion channel protein [Antarcticibacterium sp. W02-3]QCY69527.1 tetratricopeptide repeat protein [Antarcticibacterium flavum]
MNNNIKYIFFFIFLAVLPVMGQNPVLFEEGNRAYNEGDYAAAINDYQQIIDNGETSAEVYFNLGNAHYKLNNIAHSIYNYEKALQLNPNDRDIRDNLAFARNMVLDNIEEREPTGLSGMWRDSVSVLGYNQWAWLAISFAILFSIFFLIYYFNRRSVIKRLFFTLSMVGIFFSVLSVVFAFQQREYATGGQYAIIFAEEADVRGEPTLRGEEIFTLHEGTKVEVLETYQDWVRFELANGIQGWMDKTYLKPL